MSASTYPPVLVFRARLFGFEPAPPFFGGGLTLGRVEEPLERDVNERATGLRKNFVAVDDLPGDVDPAAVLVLDSGLNEQFRVDRYWAAKVDEKPAGHCWEAVPGGEQPAGLVERRGDETAMHETRRRLVALVELEIGLVLGQPLALGEPQVDPERVVSATPAGRIMVRRHARRRVLTQHCSQPPWGPQKRPYRNDIAAEARPLRELATRACRIS